MYLPIVYSLFYLILDLIMTKVRAVSDHIVILDAKASKELTAKISEDLLKEDPVDYRQIIGAYAKNIEPTGEQE